MKKNKKSLLEYIKIVVAFILGIIISGTTVYAVTILFAASDVTYDNSSSNVQATNVQGAIDELYTKAAKKEKLCKHGYYTISTGSSNYTCTKIAENQNVISLKLKGSGEQEFLSSYYDNLPDHIYVDGVSITPAESYNFASDGEHQVVMIWDDTSQVTSTLNMFRGCSSLTNLDLSNFYTSQVTDMTAMFYGCSSLTNLDLSNFDTSNVMSMRSMFYGCSSLTNLDLSNFYTSQVADMNGMFSGCSSLTNLDLSNFNTSNVLDMNGMFSNCSLLTNLDLSNFDTSNVFFMNFMFNGVSNGLAIKAPTAVCNKIASDSGITASYTCGP